MGTKASSEAWLHKGETVTGEATAARTPSFLAVWGPASHHLALPTVTLTAGRLFLPL